jgi:hypothetical protein
MHVNDVDAEHRPAQIGRYTKCARCTPFRSMVVSPAGQLPPEYRATRRSAIFRCWSRGCRRWLRSCASNYAAGIARELTFEMLA